ASSDGGAGAVRRIRVRLHFAQRQGCLGDPAVVIADAVGGVLPTLVRQATFGGLEVLDVAVAVTVAVLVHPRERPVGVGQQLTQRLLAETPTTELTQQEDEERRGVDGPVVGVATREGRRVDAE